MRTRRDVLIAGTAIGLMIPTSSAAVQGGAIKSATAITQVFGGGHVLIAGDHDAGDCIASISLLVDRKRALIRGEARAVEEPLLLRDRHVFVAVSALPFAYEIAARKRFLDTAVQPPQDIMVAEVAAARKF